MSGSVEQVSKARSMVIGRASEQAAEPGAAALEDGNLAIDDGAPAQPKKRPRASLTPAPGKTPPPPAAPPKGDRSRSRSRGQEAPRGSSEQDVNDAAQAQDSAPNQP